MLCRVSLEKKPSTAFSQEHDVGVEVQGPARMIGQPCLDLWMLVLGVIVSDGVNDLPGRNRALDLGEEADELLMPMTRDAPANEIPFDRIERGEKRCRAVAFVVVGHRRAFAALERQARLVRSSAWIWLFSSMENTTAWRGG